MTATKRRNSRIKGEGDHPRYTWCRACTTTMVEVPTEHKTGTAVECPDCGLAGTVVAFRFVNSMGQGFEYEIEWGEVSV